MFREDEQLQQNEVSKLRKNPHVIRKRDRKNTDEFYPTPPVATYALFNEERLLQHPNVKVIEPACGAGFISRELKECGIKDIESSDIRYYDNSWIDNITIKNAFDIKYLPETQHNIAIVTNPPYNIAEDFIAHCLELKTEKTDKQADMVAMLVRLNFLESANRLKFFSEYRPQYCLISPNRLNCSRYSEGLSYEDFVYGSRKLSFNGMVAFMWMVWYPQIMRYSTFKTSMYWMDMNTYYDNWKKERTRSIYDV